ncbi:IS3 family transposase [Geodermatophilus obscurus]|uniref:IS3 family transposase n=1 Tax=Geodermatophilus obscurus TaxID=1861 RepID=UPI0009D6DBA1
MGSIADCFDALAESVFATLECELFYQQPDGRFATRREAELAVFDYLETFHNPAGGTRLSARSPRRPSRRGILSPPRPEPQTAEARCPRQRRQLHTTTSTPSCARSPGWSPARTSPTTRTAPPLTAGFTAGTAA